MPSTSTRSRPSANVTPNGVTATRRSRPSSAPPSADGADVPDADRAVSNDEKPKRAQRTTLKQNPPTNKKAEAKRKPASAHRTTATQRERIRGYPEKLFIYRHSASPFWWVRYWEKGKTFRKSTKTERKQDAVAFAKQYFADLKHQIQHGKVSIRSASSYEVVLKSLLSSEYAKMSRGQLTKITYDNLVYRYEKKITPFFRGSDVQEINYQRVNDFLNAISDDDLSSSTISAYIRLVRKVLQHAARQGLITSVPELPGVAVKDTPRGWFTPNEYKRLYKTASSLAGKRYEVRKHRDEDGEMRTQYVDRESDAPRLGSLMRHVDMTRDLRYLIVFMVNAYLRPTDIKFIQHKHVDVVSGDYRYLRLRLPPTKEHSDPITTMERAVTVYTKICAHQQRTRGATKPDDYLFLPQYGEAQREYALKQLQRQFEILLEVSGLTVSASGEARTLYSLRHTCIMYRLMFGEAINTLVLARNARTSPEMIDRFYAKPLSGEMNIDMLLSRRKKVKK
jgi:hypothetical protein